MREGANLIDMDEIDLRIRLRPGLVSRRLKRKAEDRADEAELVVPDIRDWVEAMAETEYDSSEAFDSELYKSAYENAFTE